MPKKRYCSVCGRLMNEHVDEKTKEPFKVQLCSGVCTATAWNIVTKALKNGVKPQWAEHEEVKPQRRSKSKIVEYHNRIVELTNQKFTQKKIAEILGISHGTVSLSLKKYGVELI